MGRVSERCTQLDRRDGRSGSAECEVEFRFRSPLGRGDMSGWRASSPSIGEERLHSMCAYFWGDDVNRLGSDLQRIRQQRRDDSLDNQQSEVLSQTERLEDRTRDIGECGDCPIALIPNDYSSVSGPRLTSVNINNLAYVHNETQSLKKRNNGKRLRETELSNDEEFVEAVGDLRKLVRSHLDPQRKRQSVVSTYSALGIGVTKSQKMPLQELRSRRESTARKVEERKKEERELGISSGIGDYGSIQEAFRRRKRSLGRKRKWAEYFTAFKYAGKYTHPRKGR